MDKLTKIKLDWMNENFELDKLESVVHSDYPNSIFFRKDGVVVMELNRKNEYFWFDYDEIWSIFKRFFNMDNKEIQSFLRYWLEDTFKIESLTPVTAR